MRQIYEVVKNFGNKTARLDIQVSTKDELPALGELFCNFFIQAGSHAEVTQTGEWLVLDGEDGGAWFFCDGTGKYDPDAAQSAASLNTAPQLSGSPTLADALERSSGDTIDLTEQEVEQIREELDKPEEKEITEPEVRKNADFYF